MKKLYRFEADFGRMGDLQGTFVADDKKVARAIGRKIYFGEVLGKHSEIVLDKLTEQHVSALTDDAEFIAKFEKFGCASGYNPLDYLDP